MNANQFIVVVMFEREGVSAAISLRLASAEYPGYNSFVPILYGYYFSLIFQMTIASAMCYFTKVSARGFMVSEIALDATQN